jgi:hypothetical protein
MDEDDDDVETDNKNVWIGRVIGPKPNNDCNPEVLRFDDDDDDCIVLTGTIDEQSLEEGCCHVSRHGAQFLLYVVNNDSCVFGDDEYMNDANDTIGRFRVQQLLCSQWGSTCVAW